ncbi:MAG: hypothetical protein ACXVJG_19845 [Mucilaginibacter sp.]
MNRLLTLYRDNAITKYLAIRISSYSDIKYLFNKLLSYFIPIDLEINITGYIDTLYLYNKLLSYFIIGYLDISISGYINILDLYNQLHSYFITGYLNSYVSRYIATKELPCPTAVSGRSKRKSGAPDFFRLPCGAEPFLVYRWYTLPSRLIQNINKKYTLWYTLVTNNCVYE